MKISVQTIVNVFHNKAAAQIGTTFRARGLMPDCWLEVSLHPLSVAFLGPRANAELVPKCHVALHASHAALPMVTLKISLQCSPFNSINIKMKNSE
jgi:hypothetical protein